jgi:hypothetical protein
MKRKLVASLLGIISIASSYGQGSVWFDNYSNLNPNGPGGYSSPIYMDLPSEGVGGLIAGAGSVDLYYTLGTATDPNANDPFAAPIGTLAVSRPIGSPGYVNATIATIPNYVSGPITFEVVAHVPGHGGHSLLLTLPSIATGTALPGYLDGLQSFTVYFVPEPTTFALGCMGVGAFAMARNKQRRQLANETVSRSTKGNV